MKLEIAIAQLSIIDGVWQDAPDNLAQLDEATLFGEGTARGNLYIVTEVFGEPDGRDELARQIIETVRREYAASRGSISAALTQAVRAANDFFYNVNASLPAEQRRIAGIAAAVLRDDEFFITQGGPSVVCLARDQQLQRFPETSPWFIAEDRPLYDDEFTTPGTIPLGKRRNYTPDLFHLTLQPGDTVVLATRTLVHLLSNQELLDTLANRHPDEIVASLEDVANAADLSVLVLRVIDQRAPVAPPEEAPPIFAPLPAEPASLETVEPVPSVIIPQFKEPPAPVGEPPDQEPIQVEPSEEELARRREQRARAEARRAKIRAGFLSVTAGIVAVFAKIFGRVNFNRIGNVADRTIDAVIRTFARVIVFIIRAIVPGDPTGLKKAAPHPLRSTAWQLASMALPILLVLGGIGAWINYRFELARSEDAAIAQLIDESTKALTRAKQLAPSNKDAARAETQTALTKAQQARAKRPLDQTLNKPYNDAADFLDELNGILPLFAQPSFLTLTDPKTAATRIIARFPDVYIFDRGAQRVYRVPVSDAGANPTSSAGDNVILKRGEKYNDRTAGELIDMMWIDAGRLVVLDRNGAFWQYDPARGLSSRGAGDPLAWTRVNLAASYAGNLYLADPPHNQILKYVPTGDWWTSSVTYFNPGVNPDMANVVDMAIDGDVWLLRANGSILQCASNRCNEFAIKELDTPFNQPIALVTSQTLAGLYIADAGNQRIVQIDKATGRFTRQFKPRNQDRDVFKSLKAFTVDDKRFYFVNGNQAYLANIPQQ